jgi:hypothetical protein
MLFEIQAGIQQWFAQNVVMAKQPGGQQTPDAAVTVQKRVNGFAAFQQRRRETWKAIRI